MTSAGRLWAPWRQPYIAKAVRSSQGRGCLFCRKSVSRSDRKNLVLTRGVHAFSMLNLFPYNNGHLMVAPYRHVGQIRALTEAEWLDLFRVADDGLARLEKVLRPHGVNLGINLGRAAGAGIPEHLHLHLVPRWVGDTNFMPICAETKVVSQSLDQALQLLKAAPHLKKRR